MRRINSLLISLALTGTLGGCRDEPPTGITRALAVTPANAGQRTARAARRGVILTTGDDLEIAKTCTADQR
jgi:hypothetical protein